MTEATESTTAVVISVRGDAEQVVAPDMGAIRCAMRHIAASKAEALGAAAAAQRALLDDLAAFGAVPLTAGPDKPALAWLTWSAATEPEHDFDKATGRHGPTGNVIAHVSLAVYVRDFTRLDGLNALLARHERLDVQGVSWHVDTQNPAWPRVRAAAIDAALVRGRDYAAALGGTLLRVEQIADSGLLAAEGSRQSGRMMRTFATSGVVADQPGAPSLDPVPQTLYAEIDARFVAAVPPLAVSRT